MNTFPLGERKITDPRDELKTIEVTEFRVYRKCLRCHAIISVIQQFMHNHDKLVEYEEPWPMSRNLTEKQVSPRLDRACNSVYESNYGKFT
jgi:hypothetical protein